MLNQNSVYLIFLKNISSWLEFFKNMGFDITLNKSACCAKMLLKDGVFVAAFCRFSFQKVMFCIPKGYLLEDERLSFARQKVVSCNAKYRFLERKRMAMVE